MWQSDFCAVPVLIFLRSVPSMVSKMYKKRGGWLVQGLPKCRRRSDLQMLLWRSKATERSRW